METGWKPVQPHDLPHVLQRPKTGGDPCLVIDTRDTAAYMEAHIDGSINVPVPTFTPRSGAEFGHMYSLTQLESDLEPKVARKFLGRRGRRVLIYDDGSQGTETGPHQHMQHVQGGGFRIYPCLFLASLLDEERRLADPNSQPCAELYILAGGKAAPARLIYQCFCEFMGRNRSSCASPIHILCVAQCGGELASSHKTRRRPAAVAGN